MTLCPRCDGEHLEALRFQHRSVCDLYLPETQTQHADHERVRANRGRPITRPATSTELLLLAALGEVDPDQPGAVTIRVDYSGSTWRRTITQEDNR